MAEEHIKENSTCEMIEKGVAIDPNATAISFLMSGEAWDQPSEVTYGQLIGCIRQPTNMLSDPGVGATDVVTCLLPILDVFFGNAHHHFGW